MSTNEHPITPPPELVQEWYDASPHANETSLQDVANAAAQWGADQELEACIKWIQGQDWTWTSAQLRNARRPQLQTLNSIALEMLGTIEKMDMVTPEITDTIRHALEAMPND
jgi:hypothetical protein